MKSFDEFKEAMKSEAFRGELAAFLTERKPEDKTAEFEATCAFAAEKGFAVTPEELSLDKASSKQELSDEEVENAAGGNFCWSDYSCYTAYHHDKCDAIMFEEERPEAKYKIGQKVRVYFRVTRNWLSGTIVGVEWLSNSESYNYRIVDESGLTHNCALEGRRQTVEVIG